MRRSAGGAGGVQGESDKLIPVWRRGLTLLVKLICSFGASSLVEISASRCCLSSAASAPSQLPQPPQLCSPLSPRHPAI